MLLNISNHKSENWCQDQKNAALQYGEIEDINFPIINPYCTDEELNDLVDKFYKKVLEYDSPVVMLQGEFVFTYRLVNKLKDARIKVIAACSNRITVEYVDEEGNTHKKSEFQFHGFREY